MKICWLSKVTRNVRKKLVRIKRSVRKLKGWSILIQCQLIEGLMNRTVTVQALLPLTVHCYFLTLTHCHSFTSSSRVVDSFNCWISICWKIKLTYQLRFISILRDYKPCNYYYSRINQTTQSTPPNRLQRVAFLCTKTYYSLY